MNNNKKPFLNLDQQIKLLKKRNLKFSNIENAKEYLKRYNYYNIINGYSKFFIKTPDVYHDNVYFENILEVHHFDKALKTIILEYIIEAERHLKSILAYEYAERFKDDLYSYLDKNNYKQEFVVDATQLIFRITKLIKSKEKDGKQNNNSIHHYLNTYKTVPIWILIDYMTFGEIKHFFEYIPEKIRNKVARNLNTFLTDNIPNDEKNYNITSNTIQTTINNMLILRNITAHNNMILGTTLPNDIPYFEPIHKKMNINPTANRQDVYNTIVMLQMFLTKNQYAKLNNTIRKRVNSLSKKVDRVYFLKILDSLGLPEHIEKIEQTNLN